MQLKKTDYITITDNDFKIKNINNKITLEATELDLIGGADGVTNPNIGYITIDSSQFKLVHNNKTISGEFDLDIAKVSCNDLEVKNNAIIKDLSVTNNAIINELGVTNNVTSSKIRSTNLEVTNSAILPKINSRP